MLAPVPLAPVVEAAGLLMRRPAQSIWHLRTGIVVRRSSRSIPIIDRLIALLRESTALAPDRPFQKAIPVPS
jgi:hypothetical protein